MSDSLTSLGSVFGGIDHRNSDTNLPPWHDHETNFEITLPRSPYLKAKHIETWEKKAKFRIDYPSRFDKLSRVQMENHALEDNGGSLWREGLEFRFEKIVFGDWNFGLAALIAYLEANGFTNIRISYGYVPHAPEDY